MFLPPTKSTNEPIEPDDSDSPCDQLHVFPVFGKKHLMSIDCWCRPSLDLGDGLVVVHQVHH